jgi:hypothetical protein
LAISSGPYLLDQVRATGRLVEQSRRVDHGVVVNRYDDIGVLGVLGVLGVVNPRHALASYTIS